MTRDEIVELAAGYALGGLEDAERERFEALLRAGDAEATLALREFADTIADVAVSTAEAPPPRVRQALLARIDAEPRPAVVVPLAERRRRSRWPVLAAAAVAAAIAAVIVGVSVSGIYERRLAELGREAAELKQELGKLKDEVAQQRAVVALVRDPSSQVVPLAGQAAAPAARARMIWNNRAGGLLTTSGLPALAADRTYQLWAISGKSAPVSAGIFAVDASGAASVRVPPLAGVPGVDVFAVTLEPAGGLVAPSGPMVLAGKL